jgi:uncharacterized protein (DUF1697 family)
VTGYVAFLRAVNVGRTKLVMSDLRRVGDRLGLTDVRTFLQSGNLLFEADPGPTSTFEARLEKATRSELGLWTDFFVRTVSALSVTVRQNPFRVEARTDPAHLVTVFLKAAPSSGAEGRLRAVVAGRERTRVIGTEAYIVYPDGIGTSKLALPRIEGALGVRGTARNWNTVTNLLARASGAASARGEGG